MTRLFKSFAVRKTISAIAHIRMTYRSQNSPPLFPTPRSFLSIEDRARFDGCAAAYRHVESRLAMVYRGLDNPPALRPESPYVVHALAEGRMDSRLETNPGMIRGREFDVDHLPIASYPPPRSEHCRTLLSEAVETASDPENPAAVRAAWLLFTIGEIHPFQDGNGRVARLLQMLVAGEELPLTVDWGVSEQLRYYEETFMETLAHRESTATVELIVQLSTNGARLMRDRIVFLSRLVPELAGRFGLGFDTALILTATWLRQVARADLLSKDVGFPYSVAVAEAGRLVELGLLKRRLSQRSASVALPTFEAGEAAGAEARQLVHSMEMERTWRSS